MRELQQGRQLPSGSSCSDAIPSPWIPLQVWLGNPRKLQFRSVHSASFCSGQRKDKPFSSALLLPVDEAEPAGTAKISVFTTNTVLWHITLAKTVTTGIHTLLWATHLANPCKLWPALHRAQLQTWVHQLLPGTSTSPKICRKAINSAFRIQCLSLQSPLSHHNTPVLQNLMCSC